MFAEAYEVDPSTQSCEASNPAPPTQWPSHAWRIKRQVNAGKLIDIPTIFCTSLFLGELCRLL